MSPGVMGQRDLSPPAANHQRLTIRSRIGPPPEAEFADTG